jgi:hypothetical protein
MMAFKVNTNKGWTEVIIDDHCDVNKFHKVAKILENKFNIGFFAKLNSPETSYWDFTFNNSNLTLSFNIYEGISVLPAAFKEASQSDNEVTIKLSGLLFTQLAEQGWYPYGDGKTIGRNGSERGVITDDLENFGGARITLEKNCGNIPYAITLGIYGLMFHTHYEDNFEDAYRFLKESKLKINRLFELYDVPEEQRNEHWHRKHDKLMHALIG